MKPEIDDVMRYLIRMERKLDVLLQEEKEKEKK